MLKVPGLHSVVYQKIQDQLYEVFGGNFKETGHRRRGPQPGDRGLLPPDRLHLTCGYGMTECGPLISYTVFDGTPARRQRGQGHPLPRVPHRTTPIPRPASARCRSAARTLCWATTRTRRPPPRPSTPTAGCTPATWAAWTTSGFLYLTGRSKNMILTASGQNVYPEEIESQLNNLPCVEESLVLENEGQAGGPGLPRPGIGGPGLPQGPAGRSPDGGEPPGT